MKFLALSDVSLIERLLNWLNVGGEENSKSYQVAATILAIAIILFSGFLMTRLTKLLRLPNVTAYIITGIIIGPSVFNLIPAKTIEGMGFITDIALSFIAFGAGEFFKLKDLKKAGFKVVVVTLFEAFGAFILVFLVCLLLKIPTTFALVLAALSSATAPASTIMTIRQTNAKGPYVNTLLEVVALDDVVTLLLYSVAISICIAFNAGSGGGLSFESVGLPIIKNIICVAIGFGFGFLLKLLLPKRRTTDNRLIIVIGLLFLFCGICALLEQSPLLGCMAMGMVYTNVCGENDTLFKQLAYFQPPVMLCFFVLSGMNFNFGAFVGGETIGSVSLVVIALVYFVVRIIGKATGSFVGGLVTKQDKKIRNYLALGLIPQAGVAIGLAAMGSRIFIDAGGENVALGLALNTIILASSVLYELIGPASAKMGLYLSKSYSTIEEDTQNAISKEEEAKLSDVEILIKRINEIKVKKQSELNYIEEEEKAFVDAYNEIEEEYSRPRNRFMNWR